MTTKQYLHDAALRGETTIVELIAGERPVVRTSSTWFHPQGGGQKADRGVIGGVEVRDVRHGPDGVVDHFVASLEGLEVGRAYPFEIDAEWRRLNAVHHSAGHLLGGVCERLFPGLVAVNGHQWPGESRVEFQGEELGRPGENLELLEAKVNEAIAAALPIRVLFDAADGRSIQIGDFPPIPCGGTHAASSAEIGLVRLRSAKAKGGLVRIGYEVA